MAIARHTFFKQHWTVNVDRVNFCQCKHMTRTAKRRHATVSNRNVLQQHKVIYMNRQELHMIRKCQQREQTSRMHRNTIYLYRFKFSKLKLAYLIYLSVYIKINVRMSVLYTLSNNQTDFVQNSTNEWSDWREMYVYYLWIFKSYLMILVLIWGIYWIVTLIVRSFETIN